MPRRRHARGVESRPALQVAGKILSHGREYFSDREERGPESAAATDVEAAGGDRSSTASPDRHRFASRGTAEISGRSGPWHRPVVDRGVNETPRSRESVSRLISLKPARSAGSAPESMSSHAGSSTPVRMN
jgi:hypothetical protein